mgnify:CR=1 FL=1
MKMRNKLRFVVILLVFLLGTLALARQILIGRAQDNPEEAALPILGGIPKFELVDQHSSYFSVDKMEGKVTLTDFIFTTCPSVCPMMTQKKLRVFRQHQNNPKFQSLSITVNPAYDSPERLKTYAESFGIENKKWFFLTGDEKEIHRLAWEGFKVGSKTELANHSPYFILSDSQQRIRGYYNSDDQYAMKKLKKEIVHLLNDTD